MKSPIKAVSLVMLCVCLLSSVLFFTGTITAETMNVLALVGTIGWFVATPFWMGRGNSEDCNT